MKDRIMADKSTKSSAKTAAEFATPQGNAELLAACQLYRIQDVLKIIPVSRSHFLAQVAAGIFPAGIKLSPRVTCWKSSDIQKLIASLK